MKFLMFRKVYLMKVHDIYHIIMLSLLVTCMYTNNDVKGIFKNELNTS